MSKRLGWYVFCLVVLLGWGLCPLSGVAKEDPYRLSNLLPADSKIAGWTKMGDPHHCERDECLNDSSLAISQAYPYFDRGAVAAISQSYVNNQSKDGMETTIIRMRSFSHAKVTYRELGLPAYWKAQNNHILTMSPDNRIQGRMGRCRSDCRLEFSVGAYLIRLKYYGRSERERAALMDFAGEIIKKIEGAS